MTLQLQRPNAEARERASDDLVEILNLSLLCLVGDLDVELRLRMHLKVLNDV